MNKIEELQAAISDESLPMAARKEAAEMLEKIEKSKPWETLTISEMMEKIDADNKAELALYRADQLARFRVCSACCLKQDKANESCELCGASGKWESPLPQSNERGKQIAATTTYSDNELNSYIKNDSMNLAFVKHCVDVLELRGVERVSSFWERAGFNLYGRPRA